MAQPKAKDRTVERPSTPASTTATPPATAWTRPAGLSRRGWGILAAVLVLINVPVLHRMLRGEQPATAQVPYSDDFSDPATLQKHYWTSGGGLWRIVDGQLLSPGVRNNPLWLEVKLPADVAIEFDARSESPEGDLKVEVFGDGLNHQSGYVLIHGGWNNRLSIIARLDEHGVSLGRLQQEARAKNLPSVSLVDTGVFKQDTKMRVEASPFPVEIGKTYRWRIERRGSLLRWSIDGQPFMELDDPFPLKGDGHDRFGFSSWEANLYFDNLKITPL